MLRALALTMLAALLALTAGTSSETAHATSHEADDVEPPMWYYDFQPLRQTLKQQTNRAKRNRCRPTVRFHVRAWEVPAGRRYWVIDEWREKRERNQRKSSRCLPTSNIGIIRYVWPDSSENDALNVAYCESAQVYGWARAHLARNPTNPSVRGLFQIHTLWYPAGFVWSNPWHNARLALYIYRNHGGWSHWACQPDNNPFGPEPF